MRTVLISLVVLAIIAAAGPAHAQPPQQATAPDLTQPLTVDQALETAFRYSPTIRQALDRIERARGAVAEARANFNPQFNAQATYVRQGPKVSFAVPGTTQSVDIVPPYNTTAQATAFLPLDISRRLRYASEIARLQFELDYLDMLSASEQLILNVRRACYNLLRAEGQKDVAQAAVDVAAAHVKDAEARFAAGVAAQFDVTSAQTNLANLNQRLVQAQNAVEIARTDLNRVMGIDVNAPTRVAASDLSVSVTDVDIPARVQQAQTRRPIVKAAQSAVELSRRNVRLQRTGILPTLGLSGGYVYNFNTVGFSSDKDSWNAAVTLSMPIWDGGITKARVQQARADVKLAEDAVSEALLGVGTEARIASLNLEEAAKRVATAAQNVALAEEALRLATVRYNAGISILVEVTDAEASLTEARVNHVNAQYDYATALAELQRATSTQPERERLQLLAEEQQ